MKLVGVDPTRYAQHVRDVLRAAAGRARRSEDRALQPAKSRSQSSPGGGTVGLRAPGGGRKNILGPSEVLVFLKREHRRDRRQQQPFGERGRRVLAINQVVFLGSSKKIA